MKLCPIANKIGKSRFNVLRFAEQLHHIFCQRFLNFVKSGHPAPQIKTPQKQLSLELLSVSFLVFSKITPSARLVLALKLLYCHLGSNQGSSSTYLFVCF